MVLPAFPYNHSSVQLRAGAGLLAKKLARPGGVADPKRLEHAPEQRHVARDHRDTQIILEGIDHGERGEVRGENGQSIYVPAAKLPTDDGVQIFAAARDHLLGRKRQVSVMDDLDAELLEPPRY